MGSGTQRQGRPAFVLHEHRRPQHHFDLRLEEDGVLRSWALPKGVPTDPRQDRLAVAVADHELDHLTYEDQDKSIADIGWWELEDRTERRLLLVLHGRTSSVRYALIDTGRGWLLHRTKDQQRSG
jgi:DNA ligase D-like protein (predicted 3'-phosphoesterase)